MSVGTGTSRAGVLTPPWPRPDEALLPSPAGQFRPNGRRAVRKLCE